MSPPSFKLQAMQLDNDGSSEETTPMYPIVLDAKDTPPEVFHEQYEAKVIPCVIRNVPYGDSSLRAATGLLLMKRKKTAMIIPQFLLLEFKKNGQLYIVERGFKCGEDDDGYTIRMKLRYFIEYLQHNKDDSPLYIFDATFDEDKFAKRLLEDYTVPDYFSEDLFGLIGESKRPPYRWFLVDRVEVELPVVKGRKLILPGEDDEAIHYFTTILPRIKRRAATSGGKGDYSNFECYEFTQYPGETVFVPHGWWHAVMNVTHTVGVTQNYCSKRNFDEVWLQTRSGRKKMACSWLRKLQEHYPDLARRAKALNRRDRFVMWEDDPEAQRRYRKKEADKERKKREKREQKEKERARKKEKWGDHRTTERRKETHS
ncbi:JmjC domain-containing protein [Skeletonema marinoi]|uniref:JmjC domain-containing protein n=1 Tax=Skeletonema marinoi TaxID=267567 RepID=A0AAD8YDN3_9STRA|nr:JmjC domain-containing protein [Skeletonema marinoi]